jgi:5-methylcytosine-specific restriction endonuclease McrA
MTAIIGADDLNVFLDPQPDLLRRISRIRPEPGGLHVILEPFGIRSTQRLALSRHDEDLVAGLWPAELKLQAEYLYGRRLATPMVARARELGWTAVAAPQLALRNYAPGQRLYMRSGLDAADYVARWEDGDLARVGQYSRNEIRSTLWPWLIERGYLDGADESELADWVANHLGNRPAFLRPGLRLKVTYPAGSANVVERIRSDVNAILAAAHEPALPESATKTEDESPDNPMEAPWPRHAVTRPSGRREPIRERVRHEVWRRDQGRCVDCGSRERLEFDHIVPLSRGGSNTARNIELRCESCNRRKSARV